MIRSKRNRFGAICSLVFVSLLAIGLGAATATSAFAQTGLHVVAQFSSVSFYATAAVADNDIWAVGYSNASGTDEPFAVHFDGTSWSAVSTPTVHGGLLQGVSAAASNDVWAVGETGSDTLIEHWNGASWSVFKSPTPKGGGDLTAVKAIASNDVWAVGFQDSLSGGVVEHWNGTSWSLVSSPAFTSGNDILYGISADASDDVWAVGYNQAVATATALHWDGTSWSRVPTATMKHSSFHGVTMLSSTNVWAAGGGAGPPPSDTEAKIENWNGTIWSVVASPNPNPQGTSLLLGIAAVSANNIWTVGSAIEQWNGSSWSLIAPPSGVSGLNGVAALGDGTVVIVSSSGAIVEN